MQLVRKIFAGNVAANGGVKDPSGDIKQQITDAGIKYEKSGLRHINDSAREKALRPKANKFEKIKNEKCGSEIWSEVSDLAKLIRAGETTWEDLDLDDIEVRLKWAGLFHRRKRTPGRFMMRIKVYFSYHYMILIL